MSYFVLRESLKSSEWSAEWVFTNMISALRKQRQIIRTATEKYKPVKGKKYKYSTDDCYLEIIER